MIWESTRHFWAQAEWRILFFRQSLKRLLPALKPGANCNSTGTGQKCHGILEYLFRVVNVMDSVCLSLVLERYINSFDRKNVYLCLLVFIRYSFVCVNFAVRLSSQRIFYFGSPEKLLIKSGELHLKILIFLSVRKMDELTREKMQFWILKKNPILITLQQIFTAVFVFVTTV